MKILQITVLIVAAVFAATSCGQNNALKVKPPSAQAAAQREPAWKARLGADCQTAAPKEQCSGGYGFQLSADGVFRVGPGPQGQLWTGTIEPEELKELEGLVAKILPTMPRGSFSTACDQSETPGSYSLDFMRAEWPSTVALAKVAENKLCHYGAKENTEALLLVMKNLTRKYYPVPFPDTCLDSIMEVHALYQPLKACSTSKDCSNIDNTYQPVPAGEMQYVVTDDCSLIKPLITGNTAAVAKQQAALLEARSQARQVCGERIVRISCQTERGFQSAENPPVCYNRECQTLPSAR